MKFYFATDIHLSSVIPGARIDNYTETVFSKIEYLLEQCSKDKAVLLLGGDLFMTPTQPDWIKNRLKDLILKYSVRVISIVGNHDLVHYNVDYIERTSFQTLVSPGIIDFLHPLSNSYIQIDDWKIVGHAFAQNFPVDGGVIDSKTIVLSHCFYDYSKEDKLSVHRQEVYRSGAKFICFGHDHNQYPVEDNNGTLVVRPGALTRGTSHTENRVRQVGYAIIDTDTLQVTYASIPFAMGFKEVFREKYDVERVREPITFAEIQSFIDELRNAKLDVNPYNILLNLNKREVIVRKCTNYLEAVGLINEGA
jgi:DNA repair exonuclease SbcCD nuclease subunit